MRALFREPSGKVRSGAAVTIPAALTVGSTSATQGYVRSTRRTSAAPWGISAGRSTLRCTAAVVTGAVEFTPKDTLLPKTCARNASSSSHDISIGGSSFPLIRRRSTIPPASECVSLAALGYANTPRRHEPLNRLSSAGAKMKRSATCSPSRRTGEKRAETGISRAGTRKWKCAPRAVQYARVFSARRWNASPAPPSSGGTVSMSTATWRRPSSLAGSWSKSHTPVAVAKEAVRESSTSCSAE